MRLVIRADATRQNGTGHVMRSCVIAEAAISSGIDCLFIGDLGGIKWLEAKVLNVGFKSIAKDILSMELNHFTDILVLDSYQESDSWILDLKWLGTVSVVDPISPNFPTDIRIHPGLESDWLKDSNSLFLGNGDFLLVRQELRNVSKPKKNENRIVEFLVTGGGSDPYNFCREFASVLTSLKSDFSANFITDSPDVLQSDDRFSIYPAGESFNNLLMNSDLAFAPASTTCIEILSLGLPLGVALATENQSSNYKNLVSSGSALGIGTRNQSGFWEFDTLSICELIESKKLRTDIRERNTGKFNTNGVDRLIGKIIERFA